MLDDTPTARTAKADHGARGAAADGQLRGEASQGAPGAAAVLDHAQRSLQAAAPAGAVRRQFEGIVDICLCSRVRGDTAGRYSEEKEEK